MSDQSSFPTNYLSSLFELENTTKYNFRLYEVFRRSPLMWSETISDLNEVLKPEYLVEVGLFCPESDLILSNELVKLAMQYALVYDIEGKNWIEEIDKVSIDTCKKMGLSLGDQEAIQKGTDTCASLGLVINEEGKICFRSYFRKIVANLWGEYKKYYDSKHGLSYSNGDVKIVCESISTHMKDIPYAQ